MAVAHPQVLRRLGVPLAVAIPLRGHQEKGRQLVFQGIGLLDGEDGGLAGAAPGDVVAQKPQKLGVLPQLGKAPPGIHHPEVAAGEGLDTEGFPAHLQQLHIPDEVRGGGEV